MNIQTKPVIYVTTWRGHDIDLLSGPTPGQIDIEDIAHHMANNCRFNGAINRFYSDAEHSVYVSMHPIKMHAIYYLLHDAEGYLIGDLITPVKKLFFGEDYKANREYQKIMKRLKKPIIEAFGLRYDAYENLEAAIKEVDNRVYDFECKFLRGKTSSPVFEFPDDDPLNGAVFGLPPEAAEKLFLKRFHELMS